MPPRLNLPQEITSIGSPASARTLIYKSPTIFERRRRILHEARVMISELGYENFSIRELARRAGVAQRTLYNAFGSRENIVTSAIYQYSKEFTESAHYVHPPHTLIGRLERLIKVHSRNLQIRPYTTAIMAVYNSQASDRSIRQAIRKLSTEGILPFAERLAATRQLAPDVTPAVYADNVTNLMYATLSSWCVGEIPDDDMVERMAETHLLVTYGSTRGAAKKEAGRWLDAVRARSAEWLETRSQSEVPPSPRRAGRRVRQQAEAG